MFHFQFHCKCERAKREGCVDFKQCSNFEHIFYINPDTSFGSTGTQPL